MTTGISPRGLATREALTDAALELFGRRGLAATSIDDITAAAGVAKGTFYVHFQRKEDVLLEHAARLVSSLDPSGLEQLPAPRALRELGQRFATAIAETDRRLAGRTMREIVGHADDWVRVLAGRPTLWALVLPIVARGRQDGSLRDDLSPLRLAMALTVSWLDNVVGWAERPHSRPLVEAVELATDLFLGGAGTSRLSP